MNASLNRSQDAFRILCAAASYFAIVFGAGFLLGLIRVPFLVPRLGERAAELLEMPFMFIAIFLAAGFLVRKPTFRWSANSWGWVGIVALFLMMGAEVLLGVILAGREIGEYWMNRDPVSGAVYFAMLGVFAAMPWIRSRRIELDSA